ncbi:GL12864 [Drosophila persimilis]|uniref:GL12864 n=1 Tax=Drosophila persimilis TaxID=7234 RepID=B4IRA9_DROPE|nr:GL12864 [Drosophila persimilis]
MEATTTATTSHSTAATATTDTAATTTAAEARGHNYWEKPQRHPQQQRQHKWQQQHQKQEQQQLFQRSQEQNGEPQIQGQQQRPPLPHYPPQIRLNGKKHPNPAEAHLIRFQKRLVLERTNDKQPQHLGLDQHQQQQRAGSGRCCSYSPFSASNQIHVDKNGHCQDRGNTIFDSMSKNHPEQGHAADSIKTTDHVRIRFAVDNTEDGTGT